MAIGFGLGFLYFISDGLVMSLGETGAVPPVVAAWLPILVFASVGGAGSFDSKVTRSMKLWIDAAEASRSVSSACP